ncbi:MAG TPA: TIGR00180 family glycosyltransferase [Nitrospirae bacterium]|nr:TIGR00180 family glycosyltransferase [Nitrospirota bacterium]
MYCALQRTNQRDRLGSGHVDANMDPSKLGGKYTLIIPTHNRPDNFAQLLDYFEVNSVEFRIIILDSSDENGVTANSRKVGSFSLNAEHFSYDPGIPVNDKLMDGISKVETEYFSICADDDLVFLPAIAESVGYLERNLEYLTAHGYYLSFSTEENDVAIRAVTYGTPSIDSPDPLHRLYDFIRYYQPIFYGVHRTEAMKKNFANINRVRGFLFEEIIHAGLTVINGKVARIRRFYYGRRAENNFADPENPKNETGHPLKWFMRDPENLLGEFVKYRDVIIEALQNTGKISMNTDELRQYLDLLHGGYLASSLDHERIYAKAREKIGIDKPENSKNASDYTTSANWRGLSVKVNSGARQTRTYQLYRTFLSHLNVSPPASPLFNNEDVFDMIKSFDTF